MHPVYRALSPARRPLTPRAAGRSAARRAPSTVRPGRRPPRRRGRRWARTGRLSEAAAARPPARAPRSQSAARAASRRPPAPRRRRTGRRQRALHQLASANPPRPAATSTRRARAPPRVQGEGKCEPRPSGMRGGHASPPVPSSRKALVATAAHRAAEPRSWVAWDDWGFSGQKNEGELGDFRLRGAKQIMIRQPRTQRQE